MEKNYPLGDITTTKHDGKEEWDTDSYNTATI
jgi:hypothetical protein